MESLLGRAPQRVSPTEPRVPYVHGAWVSGAFGEKFKFNDILSDPVMVQSMNAA